MQIILLIDSSLFSFSQFFYQNHQPKRNALISRETNCFYWFNIQDFKRKLKFGKIRNGPPKRPEKSEFAGVDDFLDLFDDTRIFER